MKYSLAFVFFIGISNTNLFAQNLELIEKIRKLKNTIIDKDNIIAKVTNQRDTYKNKFNQVNYLYGQLGQKYKKDTDKLKQEKAVLTKKNKELNQTVQAQQSTIYLLKGDLVLLSGTKNERIKKLEGLKATLEMHLKNHIKLIKDLRTDLFKESFRIIGVNKKTKEKLVLDAKNRVRAKKRKLGSIVVRFTEGRGNKAPRYRFKLTSGGVVVRKGILPNENAKGIVEYPIWKRQGKGKNRVKLKRGICTLELTYGEGNENKTKISAKFKIR